MENFGIYIDSEVYKQRVEMIAKPKADFIIDVIKIIGIVMRNWLDIGCGGGEYCTISKKLKQA